MFIKSRKSLTGSTLVEVMVAMSIGLLVTLTTGALSLYSGRSFAAMSNYLDMEADSRNALDMLTRDVRQTVFLTDFTTNQLTFTDYDGLPVIFSYSPSFKTLTKIKNGQRTVMLSGCESLEFSIFQRNPVGGTYDYYPTANTATAKLIQVQWTCARQIFGTTANTECVQMAKIVIRKKKLP